LRLAIFGDIHANLEALQACLREMERDRVDRYLCIGDLVGYGADPKECLRLTREVANLTVVGNHEHAVSEMLDIEFFNVYAREAIYWTRRQLTPAEIQYLGSLPLVETTGEITLVHSSPVQPERFDYVQTLNDAEEAFRRLTTRLCFIGHSHVPITFLKKGTIQVSQAREVHLDDHEAAIINVGSVGQPRDRDPRACYVLYDSDRAVILFRRVEYDVESAVDKILSAGLPQILGERLRVGM